MLLQRAIEFVTASERFVSMTHNANINLNLCWRTEAKIVNVSASQRISIEVRFDFGREGQSNNDLLVQVVFKPQEESFELHDLFFNPWYQNHQG